MRLPLLLLALGTFTVGTSELVIAGILPTVAADLRVSVAAAGQLITAYAAGFGFGAPVLAAATSRLPRKPLLVTLLALFSLGNVAASVAPDYVSLMVLRVVIAGLAGTFEVVATTAAAALVPAEQRGRAIALVIGGFSVSLVIGVPLGTLVGVAFGWRATFVGLALLGTIATAALAWLLPQVEGGQTQNLLEALPLLKSPALLLAFATMAAVMGGQYVVSTYLAPFLESQAGMDGFGVAAVLFLAGASSTAGNAVGGVAADRFGTGKTGLVSAVALALGLVLYSALGRSALGATVAVAFATFAIGCFIPAWQLRLVTLAPGAADLALALNLSALNAGIALGAALGGLLVDTGHLANLGYVGGAIIALAILPLSAGLRARSVERAAASA